MEYLRLEQCCYSLFQVFQCPELSYFNVLCSIFWGHQSHTFQCHSAAESAPVKKCTFRDQSSPETNNSTFTGKHQQLLETLELLAHTLVESQAIAVPKRKSSCKNPALIPIGKKKRGGGGEVGREEQKSQENLITEKDNIKLLVQLHDSLDTGMPLTNH